MAQAETPTTQKSIDLAGLTDPTQPLESTSPKTTSGQILPTKIKHLDVQIISYQPEGGSFVVINGRRLKEGDAFDDTTIKQIEKNKVVLSNPNRKPLVLEYANLSIKSDEGRKP